MKLIKKYQNLDEADAAAMLLASRGIVVHVSGRGTKSLGYPMQSLVDAGLYAVLDHQFTDAIKFLNDNNHEVTTGLKANEMAEFKNQAGNNVYKSLNNAIMYGVFIIILCVVTAIYYDIV